MTLLKQASLDSILTTIQGYFPDIPADKIELLKRATEIATKAHENQKRASGEPYILHPIDVAQTLAEMKLDLASIIAGLLHDTVEDTAVTLEVIEKEFGKDVAELVDGVTKLNKITFKTTEEKQAENFRKMIVAMAKDIRVILVKLADRLSNMRTLEFLPEVKQKTIAQETLDIYAPIANRLGIGWIKIELEDLCLRFLHPDAYYKLATKVSKSKRDREKYIEEVTKIIDEQLGEYDVHASVNGRAKHFYSIYKKMDRRKVDFEQIFDLIAFKIVVENITECYKALGVIHATYKPVPGRFKDYIAMPKPNGYQALHTSVIGPHGERVEIQIKTQEMNMIAERGIAAHWKYKESKFGQGSRENVGWVNRLLQWHEDLSDPAEFLETVKIDLFEEEVFVFTPRGEVKQLPHGSTPIDFAYSVHTDVGNRCTGAKVNGRIVPLKYRLKSGDTIEVLTSPNQVPSKDWLKIARTSSAKAKIRAFIKIAEREKARQIGHEVLEKSLKEYQLNLNKIERSGELLQAAARLNLTAKTHEQLYIYLGYGRFSIDQLLKEALSVDQLSKKVVTENNPPKKEAQESGILNKIFSNVRRRNEARNAISVTNLDDVLIRFAKCCSPLPGDRITGFVTRGRGVTIHTATCSKAVDTDQERRVEVKWNIKETVSKRAVKIRVISLDEPGVLAGLSQAISNCGVNITSANIRTTKDKKAILLFDVEVADINQLYKLQSTLESKKEVISVERVTN